MATCEECGDFFPRKRTETWKRLCVPCWLEAKKTDRVAELEEANEDLWRRVWNLEAQLERARLPAPELPEATWRFLFLVAHPDRNENSRVSNEAVRWLLDVREKCKAGCVRAGHAEN